MDNLNRTNHMFLRVDENDQDYGVLEEVMLSRLIILSMMRLLFLITTKVLTQELLQYISRSRSDFIDTKRVLGEWAKIIYFPL